MEAVETESAHLDEDQALDVLAGRVAAARAAEIDVHLERCTECRRFLLHLARLSEHRATAPAGPRGGAAAPEIGTEAPASPSQAGDRPDDATLAIGARVDRYVIERLLGAGAMGMVYAAHDPELDRRVAVKVLRPGTFSAAARDRMAREARTLARLSHRNVVAVHDVGAHGDGMFIVMELVEGATLKRWLAERPRSWHEIVAVMAHAGRGLAAAHAAGLIHRDFKPDNVMIAADGRVLVADFGLARPAGDAATADTVPGGGSPAPASEITADGVAVGTPAYMAPEQHAGEAGPAADQFAFAVTLYEALYGRRPFAGTSAVALVTAIAAGEMIPPPSTTRVPARIARIAARGLRGPPAARFPTMTALVDALARDPGRRRRWLAVAGGALVAAVTATWLLARTDAAPERCEGGNQRIAAVWNAQARTTLRDAFARAGRGQGASAADRAAAGIDRYTREWTAGYRDACRATHVRGDQSPELLDRRMACLDTRLVELGTLVTLFATADAAVVERAVGSIAALPPVGDCADRKALDVTPLPADPATRDQIAAARADLARARTAHNAGRFAEEEPITRAIAARARTLGYPPLLASALYQLGQLEDALGHPPAALAAFAEGRLAAEAAGNDKLKAELAIASANIANATIDPEETERMDREAEATVARLGSPPELAWLLADGKAKRRYGVSDFAGALAEWERALAIARTVFPADSYEVANLLNAIGVSHFALGAVDKARPIHEEVRAMRLAVLGPDHPALAETLQNLGNCNLVGGRPVEALALYTEAIAIMERGLGPDHPRIAAPHHNLGMLYLMQSDPESSARHSQRAYDILRASSGDDDPQAARSRSRLAVALAHLGRIAEAKTHAAAAVATLSARIGAEHPETALARLASGDVFLEAGEPAAAVAEFREALPLTKGTASEEYTLLGLGRSELALGHGAAAAEHLAGAIAGAQQLYGADAPNLMTYYRDLGRAHLADGHPERAIAPLERGLELDRANGDGTLAVIKGGLRLHLARALWSRPADRDRARALADEALAALSPLDPAPPELAELRAWLTAHRRR
jgi:tetratricopeptide (TPR) repeat protein